VVGNADPQAQACCGGGCCSVESSPSLVLPRTLRECLTANARNVRAAFAHS
jgi:hypothetical protein